MSTNRARPKSRRASRPRRNPPDRYVVAVLRRARAVAALAEHIHKLGRAIVVECEYGSCDVGEMHAEADQIIEAAERVVREVTEILGDG